MLRPEALSALSGAERIIHAGDVGSPEILEQLREIGPVTTVRGNVDTQGWARKLPDTDVLELPALSVFVIHDLSQLDLKPEAAGFRVVVYGHSHVPKMETRNGVLYFNPGSAGPRRFKLPITVGRLMVEGESVRGQIVRIVD